MPSGRLTERPTHRAADNLWSQIDTAKLSIRRTAAGTANLQQGQGSFQADTNPPSVTHPMTPPADSETLGLLAAARTRGGDDLGWLVLADRLDEIGQAEAAGGLRASVRGNTPIWLGDPDWRPVVGFYRGVPVARSAVGTKPAVSTAGWVCGFLTHHGRDAGLWKLVRSRVLARVCVLRLVQAGVTAGPVGALVASPKAARLADLDLSWNEIGQAVPALADSPQMAGLTRLGLTFVRFGPAGVRALAESPYLTRLTELGLAQNLIGPDGTAALARSATLARLTVLDLTTNRTGDAGAIAVARSESLTRLGELSLKDNGIRPAGVAAIAGSPNLAELTALDLSWNVVDDRGATALAESPHLGNLTRLALGRNPIGKRGVRAIKARFPFATF